MSQRTAFIVLSETNQNEWMSIFNGVCSSSLLSKRERPKKRSHETY